MKRTVRPATLTLLIFLSVSARLALADTAGGERGVELCANAIGDVNASGATDFTDAIAVLSHLFLGDPESLAENCATGDVEALQAQLAERDARLAEQEAALAEQGSTIAEQEATIGGFLLGALIFTFDFPLIGDTKVVTDEWGIPFMMQAWWLFVICSAIFIITSLLTPHRARNRRRTCAGSIPWQHSRATPSPEWVTPACSRGFSPPRWSLCTGSSHE